MKSRKKENNWMNNKLIDNNFMLLFGMILLAILDINFALAYSESSFTYTQPGYNNFQTTPYTNNFPTNYGSDFSNSYTGSSYSSIYSGYGSSGNQFPSSSYLSGQGISLYGPLGNEQCGQGNDFIIQVAPFGCSPAVVRSDLLEEQNVPVFCQLAATQLNPLIKVNAIDSLTFSSKEQSNYVSGVGFHPANAAIRGYGNGNLLNSPVLSNIGYAVIVLKKQGNESSMPEFVQGNLTATIRYDMEKAFGIGKADFLLPVLNSNQWSQDFKKYSFWNGKGYLKAEAVDANSATISLYTDEEHRVSTVTLRKGETSKEIYLPGFYCTAKLNLVLNDLVYPDTSARLKIDDNSVELVKGQTFLNNKCQVLGISGSGLMQTVSLTCKEDDRISTFDLKLTPKVQINYNGENKNLALGDFIGAIDGNKQNFYLTYIGQDTSSLNKYFIIVSNLSSYKGNILSTADLNSYGSYSFNNQASSYSSLTRINTITNTQASGKISNQQAIKNGIKIYVGSSGNLNGANFDFVSFASAVDNSYNVASNGGSGNVLVNGGSDVNSLEENFQKSISDYKQIVNQFGLEKKEPNWDKSGTYGEQALWEASILATAVNKLKTRNDLLSELIEKYPQSEHADEARGILAGNILNSAESMRGVFTGGDYHVITFNGIYSPDTGDYNVDVFVSRSGGNSQLYSLGKAGIASLNSASGKDYLTLSSLNEQYANFDLNYQDIQGSMRTTSVSLRLGESRIIQGTDYTIKVSSINVKRVAKISLVPQIDNRQTTTNLSYRIGIEKRAIQLSPDEIKSRIKTLNETISTLDQVSSDMRTLVKGFKATCIATEAALTVKNFFKNTGGAQIAREKVMRNAGGWNDVCVKLVKQGKYNTMSTCFYENRDAIDKDVSSVSSVIETQNSKIKTLQAQNKDEFANNYRKDIIIQLQAYSGQKITDPSNANNKIEINKVISSLQSDEIGKTLSVDDLREIELALKLKGSSLSDETKSSFGNDFYSESLRVTSAYDSIKDTASFTNSLNSKGFSGVGLTVSKEAVAAGNVYDGGTATTNTFGITSGTPVQAVLFEGNKYILTLKLAADNLYTVDKVYNENGGPVSDTETVSISGKKVNLNNAIKAKFSNFKKYNSQSYQNLYKKPEASYHETAPYKGLPAIVPFDLNEGWYSAVKGTLPTGVFSSGMVSADQSGKITSFYLCNVGKNGIEEFELGIGDDICEMINTGVGQPYGQFAGLDESSARKKISDGMSAIQQAQRQYKEGVKSIKINGQTIPVGKPAVSISDVQCQDFMSPSDCQLMFNVCDPVICPPSRCNLGGNYYVPDVIQSGIVGSVALCLPNYKEGIAVPICLSGVSAGLESLNSVFKNYRDCLQENLASGKLVGVCDEINSIYMCEFFWRQIAPAAQVILPKLFGAMLGEGSKGGGEYMTVTSAWSSAEGSLSYFTNYYAANSMKAFQARSTDEAGTEVCKSFISARYPSGGDFLDNLITPDSPPQYTAWFDEVKFTTATIPPTSQYKVFYHIYGGKDMGRYFTVSLRGAEGTSMYGSPDRYIVATGYATKGGYKSETKDFTAPSGYKELCVSVDANEECGFQKVSTSFALNYVEDKYLQEQASQTQITTEKDCISGTPSVYSLVNPNLEAGVNNAINPQLYNSGIVRVCATDSPGKGTDSYASIPAQARWKDVGNCGSEKVRCWLDSQSVKDNINTKSIENATLGSASASYLAALQGQGVYRSEADTEAQIEKISKIKDPLQVITEVSNIYDSVIFSYQKAKLLLQRAEAYGTLAVAFHNKVDAQLKAANAQTGTINTVSGNCQDECNKIADKAYQGFNNGCYEDNCGEASVNLGRLCKWNGDGKCVEDTGAATTTGSGTASGNTATTTVKCEDCKDWILGTCTKEECEGLGYQMGKICKFTPGTFANSCTEDTSSAGSNSNTNTNNRNVNNNAGTGEAVNSNFPTHNNIIATTFWVGEDEPGTPGSGENMQSAFDTKWSKSYFGDNFPAGGDSSIYYKNNGGRDYYCAKGYVPDLSPFYLALPCRPSNTDLASKSPYNEIVGGRSWIMLRKGNNVCYAQFMDLGPWYATKEKLNVNCNYVFWDGTGNEPRPYAEQNSATNGAGIDLSPVLTRCLSESSYTATQTISWQFVSDSSVPSGPWNTWKNDCKLI